MARLKSDLVDICLSALEGELAERTAVWDSRAALGVVMAAGGYPAGYEKGKVISGLDGADSDTQKVFHAGTSGAGDKVTTSGGRVLCVVGLGDTVGEAARDAYAAVSRIDWEDAYYRRDIGHRAIAREAGVELSIDDFPVLSRALARRSKPPEVGTRKIQKLSSKPPARPAEEATGATTSIEAIRARHAVEEREAIVDALERSGGNVSAAARSLGMSRYQLLRRIRKHGLR